MSKNGTFSTLCQNGTLFSTFFGTTIPSIDASWRVLSIYMGMLGGYRVCEKSYLQKTENSGLSELLAHIGTKERGQSNSDQRPLLSSGWKVLWHIWIFLIVQVERDMNFYFLREEKNCDVTVTSQPRPIWKLFPPLNSPCKCLQDEVSSKVVPALVQKLWPEQFWCTPFWSLFFGFWHTAEQP